MWVGTLAFVRPCLRSLIYLCQNNTATYVSCMLLRNNSYIRGCGEALDVVVLESTLLLLCTNNNYGPSGCQAARANVNN